MAYPIHPSEGYVRTPGKYPHDAFGADTGGRVRPHTGLDSTPNVPNARNRAVVSGVVTRVGYSQYTGNYVEIRDAKGRYWLTFHQRENLVKPGSIVAENAVIGVTGNTGGSGAIGSAKIGVHNHTSLCINQGAATRLITGQVRARYKNETVAQWAADRGLLDPWPIIRDGDKNDAPATGGDQGDDMFSDDDRKLLQRVDSALTQGGFHMTNAILDNDRRAERGILAALVELGADADHIRAVTDATREGQIAPGGYTYDAAILGIVAGMRDAKPGDVDSKAIASAIVENLPDTIAQQVLDGLAKRLTA